MMKRAVLSVFTVVLCVFFVVSLSAQEKASPKVVVLDSISNQYEAVQFNHEMHVMIGGGAGNCSECHHQHPVIEKQACNDCHSIESTEYRKSVVHSFLSCQSCHGAYDISNPAMPDLKVAYHSTCFKCHKGIGNIGIDPKGCTEMCHAKKSENVSMNDWHRMPSAPVEHVKDEEGGTYGKRTKTL